MSASGANGDASGDFDANGGGEDEIDRSGGGGGGGGGGGEQPDLFEYFDPLLSPHSYPRGISPDAKPSPSSSDDDDEASGGGAEGYGRRESSAPPTSFGGGGGGGSGGFITVPDDIVEEEEEEETRVVNGGDEDSAAPTNPDLLDYFDPLLNSPHAYPDGIDAAKGKKSVDAASSGSGGGDDEEDDWSPLRMRSSNTDSFFGEGTASPSSSSSPPAGGNGDGDGDGNGGRKPKSAAARQTSRTTVIRASTPSSKREYKRPHGMDGDESAADVVHGRGEGDDGQGEDSEKKPDLFDVFDPRISPHAYASGIPDAVTYAEDDDGSSSITYSAFQSPSPAASDGAEPVQKSSTATGVLLIDHGSRRGLSNARLRTLSLKYDSLTSSDFIVRHAHMEIAKPSIEDGLRQLVTEVGCTKVMCVPYFLSVGKHSTVDVPRLIEEACETLETEGGAGGMMNGDVTVITTDPVGSNVDVMLGAIDAMVQGTLEDLDEVNEPQRPEEGRELGGLFGDIKRMMDEQL